MILAVLQARFSSSRFPGKVMKDILGEPVLYREIERVLKCESIDKLVVATSTDPSDDPIAKMCFGKEIDCFRGSLEDVLDRFYHAAEKFSPDHVIRLTGDCPLADPFIIDAVVRLHILNNNDYTCNDRPPTFPDGLDAEILTFKALELAQREAILPSEREHVTSYIYTHPERFKIGNLERSGADLSDLRWTIDEPEDFLFIAKIYEALYPQKADFSTQDVLNLLESNADLKKINDMYGRNEGYSKSLLKDGNF